MHNNWEEMIPFYIAGTLPKAETSRLENHLAGCDECRKSLEEWRVIADAVRSDAAGQLRDLPPLSAQVLSVAQRRAARAEYARPTHTAGRPATRSLNTSVTLIAAVFTVIIFGGLLAFMVLRGVTPKQGGVVLLPTATAVPTEEATASKLAPSPFPSTSPEPLLLTPTDAPQIIVIDASLTPTPTLTPLAPKPTLTPSLVFATRIVPTLRAPTAIPPLVIQLTQNTESTQNLPTAILLPTTTPEPFAQSMMLGMGGGPSCLLQAAIPNTVVNLYAGPGTDYPVVKTFSNDDQVAALGRSDNGWYEAQYTLDSSLVIGWVRQELVFTIGTCDALPVIAAADYQVGTTPTDTAIPPIVDLPLVSITSDGINLRSGPGTNYPIVGSASLGENYHVEAQSSNGNQLWYLITVPGARSAWVYGNLVQLSPANALIAPAMTIPPSPMPTNTASAPASTLTPGVNIAAGHWSQTVTVLSTTCAGGSTGISTTTPVTLSVASSGDSINLAYADAGTPFTLFRGGDRTYTGGYSTANTTVNVTLTFTSSTGYSGSAVITQNDGCTVQSAWNGLFQSP